MTCTLCDPAFDLRPLGLAPATPRGPPGAGETTVGKSEAAKIELTLIIRVQLGLELLHFLVVSQQRPVLPQRPHPVLLLLLHRLLDEGVLLVVCDACVGNKTKEGSKVMLG